MAKETRPLRASACFAILAKQQDLQLLVNEVVKEHELPGEGWRLDPNTRTATRDVPDAPKQIEAPDADIGRPAVEAEIR